MPGLDYRELRQRISLRQVLALLNYQPTTCHGLQARGPCPFCSHPTPTPCDRCFTLHLGRHLFHCHRCGASGNALDLWQRATALPLYAAALDLCERLRITPPQRR